MSKFTTPAVLEMLGDYRWRLVEPFEFWQTERPDDVIYVPEGYVTDLASVPRILWSVFPPHGRYAEAAIIHDWLYDNALRTKAEADRIFLDAMKVLGVPRWRRVLMYAAVRLFGRGNYGEVRYKPLEK
ncbi:DUF1353 domain-containing protein [Escherichia coli]|nr:DUF1353 domain-containing protein [Escherichia coli]